GVGYTLKVQEAVTVMMNYFRVGIPLLTGLNEMLNVNQERKYIEPLLVSKRHSSTFYIAGMIHANTVKILP
ncbi:hypothetical protein EFO80_11200, partial [Lacticaseibacillus rhamnosus]|nr:hypothetical protein [Lacticaseibacillus rhamnosus]MCT3179251.1 hypothetical protein [Lacticaseibacillus rhamnosus]MCT4449329.1 hypothetical protein [Lacticaseibacillus rhamnosus]